MSESDHWDISDLRQAPDYAGVVADRIWRAWWRDDGYPLDHIQDLLQENLRHDGAPIALVARTTGGSADADPAACFMGTASVIASDMAARPQYTPWVAAVWVEPAWRRQGVGAALVMAALHAALALGHERVFLCATPENSGFYEGLGWLRIESGVDGLNIFCWKAGPVS